MKIVVGVSGASGAALGLKLVRALPTDVQKHLILSDHAQVVLDKEENLKIHQNNEIWASIASGSYGADAMIITPCSMNTLAKIACGIADNLITRAAAVMIKERRTLVLAPREIPFSPIALENMHKLSMLGVIIAPPVLAYYGEQNTLEDMENFMIGKWFDLLGIPNDLYKRWSDHDA
ncbi:MAG: UbiX family flavin prenyltransferase [Sulfuricurvum sp.]|uniref:UbiX family flavin prenyltransferase n=1 Tax=Sulfuricurvum sp. TaxID=2025608 RepID=UPI00262F6754|nr:UbiX family flavin prenyltransferase [Sulfuricurvum sp.]MDD2369779.1 UbiX family flavin prenyltransferase [Sulfuricurvum sp.]MDD2949612.1 UbiX family flavin prenyltransferase [Sulfuricurvum sp.]MDD5118030.1 UbiX family flavin prenyltransferase [Sulfuricurvum sp.]